MPPTKISHRVLQKHDSSPWRPSSCVFPAQRPPESRSKLKFQENNLVAYQTECHLGKKHHPLQGEKQSKRAISAGCQNISEVPDPVRSTFFGHLRFWRWRGFWGLGVAAESGCMNHDGPSEPKTYALYGFRFRNFFPKVLKQNIALQITCPMLAVWVSTWGLGSSIRQWPQVFPRDLGFRLISVGIWHF